MSFTFLDGEWECEPYPRECFNVVSQETSHSFTLPVVDRFWSGPFRSHYDSATGIGLDRAIRRVLAFANANGPFEGIFGFSQGAALAAAILASNSSTFQFGILFCGGRPTEAGTNARWATKDLLQGWNTPPPTPPTATIGLDQGGESPTSLPLTPRIRVPTAHFAGRRDPLFQESLALYSTADVKSAQLMEFDEGHTIPRTSAVTLKIANTIRATARRAA